ncbi:MAG: type II toxin-antitoxin system HicB family antitoxin [Candidatus Babeliaceae bacterium]|jgi:antitoxin HicB
MQYHFKIHKEAAGFWAECIELEGCFTQADTKEELQLNMQEALNLYVEERSNSKDLAAMPDKNIKNSRTIIEVSLDPQVAFSFLVRYWRIKYGWTQKQAAKKMGFEKLYSYQRLEARRCNPSLKIISMIKKIYPDFSIDFALTI